MKQLSGVLIALGLFLSLPASGETLSIVAQDTSRIRTEVLRAFEKSKAGESAAVVAILEPLFIGQLYGYTQQSVASNQVNLKIGAPGSFQQWRELAYLLLGQSYYKQANWKLAKDYFLAIPKDSPYYRISLTGGIWAALNRADSGITEWALEELGEAATPENQIQKSFIELRRGKEQQAVALAQAVAPSQLSPEIQAIRLKILAQGEYQQLLTAIATLPFSDKKKRLERVFQYLDAIPQTYRDSATSALGAEVHWHLSSVLRIEDTSGNSKLSQVELARANSWIEPWIARANKTETYLDESAHFLAVALLWEQEKKEAAIPRLLMLPRYFPMGEYREDASQLLADYYFDNGKFDEAVKYYGELTERGSEKKAVYGMYKAAWAFYNKGEKWKALRHLEQLVLHYRDLIEGKVNDTGEASQNTQGALVKESIQDMVLILAELLPVSSAFSEIDYFKLNAKKEIELKERLGKLYREIGKNDEAIEVWSRLMASDAVREAPDKYYDWTAQLMQSYLSAGKRRQIAEALERAMEHAPSQEGVHIEKAKSELEKQAVQLVLTIHREARKTDDNEIWVATDALYKMVAKYFPTSHEGDLWYFGAQRKEQTKAPLEAMKWYQTAANQVDYKNRTDAAISALRHAQEQGKIVKDLKPLTTVLRWYVDTFPKTKERRLAEFLYLEYLSKMKESEEAESYLLGAVNKEGLTANFQEQYLTYNARLYEGRMWPTVNHLANSILELDTFRQEKKSDFKNKLLKFRQEAAFENAFQEEKKKNLPEARRWYLMAAKDGHDSTISLKAWHNLLIGFAPGSVESERSEFEKLTAQFDLEVKKGEPSLLYDVYSHRSQYWDGIDLEKKLSAMNLAVKVDPDRSRSSQTKWEMIALSGVYGDLEGLRTGLSQLVKEKSDTLKAPSNRVSAARLLMWNGDFSGAYAYISELIQRKEGGIPLWATLADLYKVANEDEVMRSKLRPYLERAQVESGGNSSILSLTQQFTDSKETLSKLETISNEIKTKEDPEKSRTFESPEHELKMRVDRVALVLKNMASLEQKLAQFVQTKSVVVSVRASCSFPILYSATATRLMALRTPEIKSKQWKQFYGMLDAKIRELNAERDKGAKVCDAGNLTLSLLPILSLTHAETGYLCNKQQCFRWQPSGSGLRKPLEKMEYEWSLSKAARVDRVWNALQIGAWAMAENTAYQAQDVHEKALCLGLLRIALNDTVSAGALLTEAKGSKIFSDSARALLATIYFKNGYPQKAVEELKPVKLQALPEWLRDLVGELK